LARLISLSRCEWSRADVAMQSQAAGHRATSR
jgi:hypothetical protein